MNFSLKKQVKSYDIYVHITVSICKMNYDIKYSKCPLLADTHA